MSSTKGSKDEVQPTECLIDSLCNELTCIKVMRHPLYRLVPWVIIAAVYLAVSVGYLGIRPDIHEKVHSSSFIFEISLIIVMTVEAAMCSQWLCVPDMRDQKWMLAVPLSLFAVFVMWTVARLSVESFAVPYLHWHTCYTSAIIFGAIPGLVIFFLSMCGKTTQPFMLSAMNTLAIGGVGYLGLRLTCRSDDIGHICSFHILPYILLAFAASVMGRKIYRW